MGKAGSYSSRKNILQKSWSQPDADAGLPTAPPRPHLVELDRLEQGTEITLTEAFVALGAWMISKKNRGR